jgi:hypothetical protein
MRLLFSKSSLCGALPTKRLGFMAFYPLGEVSKIAQNPRKRGSKRLEKSGLFLEAFGKALSSPKESAPISKNKTPKTESKNPLP